MSTAGADTLTDGLITLRPWRPDDWRAVFDACQDEQIARYTPNSAPLHGGTRRTAIADWTLATTDLIRLDLFAHPENHASGRVAIGAGFAREGVRWAWELDRDGNPEDAIFYVLVRGG